jgi:hypothetical protein
MKNTVRMLFAVACLVFSVRSAHAGCEYSYERTITYWQYHLVCSDPGPHGMRACNDWWSDDGECIIDCDGNETCTGDTEMRSSTYTTVTITGSCAPVCD